MAKLEKKIFVNEGTRLRSLTAIVIFLVLLCAAKNAMGMSAYNAEGRYIGPGDSVEEAREICGQLRENGWNTWGVPSANTLGVIYKMGALGD